MNKPLTNRGVAQARSVIETALNYSGRPDLSKFATLAEYRTAVASTPLTRCAAARDGDCTHPACPQLGDNEPTASGRHCPIDTSLEDEQ